MLSFYIYLVYWLLVIVQVLKACFAKNIGGY
jgi:hypothetical protein